MIPALILRRCVLLAVTLFAVSVITFLIVNVLPGDVANAILGDLATPDQVASVRTRMGLDRPLVERYLEWAGGLLRGDFGVSLTHGRPIAPILFGRFGNSIILALISLAVAVPVSILLGVVAAVYQGSVIDRVISSAVVVAFSLPEYVLALGLILLFAMWIPILPGSSMIDPGASPLSRPAALVLPIAVIATHMLAYLSQVTRASMIATLGSGYVRTATLKGLPGWVVVARHALRNALLPTLAEIGMNFGYTLGGLVIVETVFSYAGIGQLVVMSVETRDVPTLQAAVLVVAAAYGIGNLLADIGSIALNPKLRS